MEGSDPELLMPATFIDSDAPEIVARAAKITRGLDDERAKSVALFESVRDGIRYNPYSISLTADDYRASRVLASSSNWCVPKAILLTALARAAGITAAVGFSDVRNHLSTPKLMALMGSDLFSYHGYTAFWLGGQWVKATPAFNMEMCRRFAVQPLVFDGEHDTLFHEFDSNGQRHMEYVNDRGLFIDAPVAEILADVETRYPLFAKKIREGGLKDGGDDSKFTSA